jgi:hypothetical protein
MISGDQNNYFRITHDEINHLVHMGTENYYLQSNGYEKEGKGLKLDLLKGSLNLVDTKANITLSKANTADSPLFTITRKWTSNGTNMTRNLVEIGGKENGEDTFYLQSSDYTTLYVKTLKKGDISYSIYIEDYKDTNGNDKSRTVAIPPDFLTRKNSNGTLYYTTVYIVNGDSITNTTHTIPTQYTFTGYTQNGEKTDVVEKLSNPQKSYLARLRPVLLVDPNKPGKGLYIDLNKGLINGYDLYLRGLNRSDSTQT